MLHTAQKNSRELGHRGGSMNAFILIDRHGKYANQRKPRQGNRMKVESGGAWAVEGGKTPGHSRPRKVCVCGELLLYIYEGRSRSRSWNWSWEGSQEKHGSLEFMELPLEMSRKSQAQKKRNSCLQKVHKNVYICFQTICVFLLVLFVCLDNIYLLIMLPYFSGTRGVPFFSWIAGR